MNGQTFVLYASRDTVPGESFEVVLPSDGDGGDDNFTADGGDNGRAASSTDTGAADALARARSASSSANSSSDINPFERRSR